MVPVNGNGFYPGAKIRQRKQGREVACTFHSKCRFGQSGRLLCATKAEDLRSIAKSGKPEPLFKVDVIPWVDSPALVPEFEVKVRAGRIFTGIADDGNGFSGLDRTAFFF